MRIVVVVEGGILQDVLTDSDTALEVLLVDYDTEGTDEEDLTPVPQTGDHPDELAYVATLTPSVNPERVQEIFNARS